MGQRRIAREWALKALFCLDLREDAGEGLIALFRENFLTEEDDIAFFDMLVRGVLAHIGEIDSLIEKYSSNWRVRRMSCVDRNVMRMAVYEMDHCQDIPAKVSINEAIEIGKRFGTRESGRFINGILDSIRNREVR